MDTASRRRPGVRRLGVAAHRALVPVTAMMGVLALAHCSPSSDVTGSEGGPTSGGTSTATTGPTGGAGGGDGGSGTAATGAGGTFLGTGGGTVDPDAGCAYVEEQGEATPLNLYIMFDKSSSMVGDKWESAKAGLATFLALPDAAGVRVALRFFPRDADATPACDQMAYKEPLVPFAELPGNAAALTAAMDAESPDGFATPMYPALGGAILKGIEVAQNGPGETSAVLLVSDGKPMGEPSTCGGVDALDPAVIAALAATGAAYSPSVLTYVIGLPGIDQSVANQIAAAGGSDKAILVSVTNVEVEFLTALSKVLGEALPCDFEIPAKVLQDEVEITSVNVAIVPGGGGEAEVIPQNADCDDGEGWAYDDANDPQKIVLCSATCDALKADYKNKIQIRLGCATIIK